MRLRYKQPVIYGLPPLQKGNFGQGNCPPLSFQRRFQKQKENNPGPTAGNAGREEGKKRKPMIQKEGFQFCNCCGIGKPLCDYDNSSKAKNGVRTICKTCDGIYNKARREGDYLTLEKLQKMKRDRRRVVFHGEKRHSKKSEERQCAVCLSGFYPKAGRGRGKTVCSKSCEAKRKAETRIGKWAKCREKVLVKYRNRERQCKECGVVHFRFRQQHCSLECRDKRLTRKRRESLLKRKSEHPEIFRQRSMEQYKRRDKAKKNSSARSINKQRRRLDPLFLLKERIRSRTQAAFKIKGIRKSCRTLEMIGCDGVFLKAHIEAKFSRGMSWANAGEWHIDHIIPLASARSEAELIRLAHFSNLRPMWAAENISKSDKIVTCQPELTLKLIS